MKKEVYVVAHCHWDAEWYFTCEDSHILLTENMDYLIDLLERDPTFPSFTFDGLAVVLDEYLQVRPENAPRLEALIGQRRLFVGPWYTQCDSLLIRTESLIRNLQYGIATAQRFGHSMNIGYLPDIFGQHAYLPAIFGDLGIDYAVLQRGVYTDQLNGDLNFIWRAPNQKTLPACCLYFGYGPGKFLSTDADYVEHRLQPILERLTDLNRSTDKLLLPAGGDQVLANAQFPQTVKALNELDTPYHFHMTDYESYLRDAWAGAPFSNVIDGELVACQKSRIHRTCHSTRYDIKRQTWQTEHLLLDQLEPLMAVASHLGVTYPQPVIDSMWKTLFAAHAHNGIEATNADAVNQNIKNRLISVERSALSLLNVLKKKISYQIARQQADERLLVVFNCDISPLSPLARAVIFTQQPDFTLTQNGVAVESTLLQQEKLSGGQVVIVTAAGEKLEPVADYYRSEILFRPPSLPGLGYQTLRVDEQQACARLARRDVPVIENARYRISLTSGVLTLENKQTGQRVGDFLTFVDCGDDGDEFDFAPLADEQPLTCREFHVVTCESSAQVSRLTLRSSLTLPANMAERQAGIARQKMAIATTLELRDGEGFVRVHHQLINAATEHRLRVHLKTPVEQPNYSFADQGFSIIRRETVNPYVAQWRELGFVEKPMPIYTLENVVYLQDEQHCFGVITKGIKEYEVLPESDTLALTLFRSVGLLGKDDTLWRPGRASGINNKVVETPDAQMLQEMEFDYALLLDGPQEAAAMFSACRDYREHYLTYQVQKLNTFEERLERFTLPIAPHGLPPQAQLIACDNPRLFLSMCRPGARDGETLVRLFNPTPQSEICSLTVTPGSRIYQLSLNEARRTALRGDVAIAPGDYLTLAIVTGELQ